jgi:hypothetical protein
MQTIIIDGKEYVLVPKEQLQPVPTPTPEVVPDSASTPLQDFLGGGGTSTPPLVVDDGLATSEEKKEAIRVVTPSQTVNVPKAQPKTSPYREKFLKKELGPEDVASPPKFHREMLTNNPEDPMIKADAQRPASQRLFYGPGAEFE